MNTEKQLIQFEVIRAITIKSIESITEEIADEMPAGYKNTIRWNLGHIIAVADAFLFNFAGIPMYLSPEHFEMFKSGSKPADWTTQPPSLEELTGMFKGQIDHIKKHLEGRSFEEKTKNTFNLYGNPQETLGEVLSFCQYHEGFHLGYINGRTTKTLKRALI
ncbi:MULTISPECIES: DinB family protein [unclassified Bacillus (in: firmicutes)]|uniref:DinB family protein n=1 Tax=unclassified Bacillus (in: firmicutes) TaxID=185979 RepID=UPI0008DF092C|nr:MULTISPECIES: DinB family protein [unclassified Bacillus (in: firmicutes)]SFB19680.1 DinB superfamily protein [Bacillus sp. UNCCL13]SFQ90717.1 DinB superfamily protein [Bacillus sp. cl95]